MGIAVCVGNSRGEKEGPVLDRRGSNLVSLV